MLNGLAANELAALLATERVRQLAQRMSAAVGDAPESVSGLTRDRVIDAAIATREPDGTWGTQTKAATGPGGLGLADARRIRQVQGPRGWAGIIADAEARLTKS
jgi:hypothetical protein